MTAEKSSLPNYRWIKFDIEYLNNPDFMSLSDAAAGVYTKLYLLAGKSDAGGLLTNTDRAFTEKDLRFFLRCSAEALNNSLAELIASDFITLNDEGYSIRKFMDEQGPGDDVKREGWRKRQAEHRAKKADADEEAEQEEVLNLKLDSDSAAEIDIESHRDVTVTGNHAAGAESSFPFSEQEEALIANYEAQIGKLSPVKQKEFIKLLEEYPADWLNKAIAEAADNKGRSLNYVETILSRWKVQGFDNSGSKNGGKRKLVRTLFDAYGKEAILEYSDGTEERVTVNDGKSGFYV
jgi:DnaD/phage-associated family protein